MKRILFATLKWVFWLIAPLTFVILEYSTLNQTKETVSFQIGITGIAIIIIILILAKKLLFKKYLQKLDIKIANAESALDTETDVTKIELVEKSLHKYRLIQSVFSFVMPVAFLSLALYTAKALENAIVKLSGVLGFILISFVLGEIMEICEIQCIKSKHRPKEVKSNEERS